MGLRNVAVVEQKIREFNGNLAAVGRTLGVTRQAVHEFVNKRPALLAVVADCREEVKDHAESALYRAVLAGEQWAILFTLRTIGKDRGYVERVQHESTHVLEVTEEIVSAPDDRVPDPQTPGSDGPDALEVITAPA